MYCVWSCDGTCHFRLNAWHGDHLCLMPLQVETKTKTDIEEKKKQLRQLVGGSYRCDFYPQEANNMSPIPLRSRDITPQQVESCSPLYMPKWSITHI